MSFAPSQTFHIANYGVLFFAANLFCRAASRGFLFHEIGNICLVGLVLKGLSILDQWIRLDDVRLALPNYREWDIAAKQALHEADSASQRMPFFHTTGNPLQYTLRSFADRAALAQALTQEIHPIPEANGTWARFRESFTFLDNPKVPDNPLALLRNWEPSDDECITALDFVLEAINRTLLDPGPSAVPVSLFEPATARIVTANNQSFWDFLLVPFDEPQKAAWRAVRDNVGEWRRGTMPASYSLVSRINRLLIDRMLGHFVRITGIAFDTMLMTGSSLSPEHRSSTAATEETEKANLPGESPAIYYSLGRPYPLNFGLACLGFSADTEQEIMQTAAVAGKMWIGHFSPLDSGAVQKGYIWHKLPSAADLLKDITAPLSADWRGRYLRIHLSRYHNPDMRSYFKDLPDGPSREDPYGIYPQLRRPDCQADFRAWCWELRISETISFMKANALAIHEMQADILSMLREITESKPIDDFLDLFDPNSPSAAPGVVNQRNYFRIPRNEADCSAIKIWSEEVTLP